MSLAIVPAAIAAALATSSGTARIAQDAPAGAQQPAASAQGQPVGLSNIQLSVLADARAVLNATHKDDETAKIHELELGFASDVDPYLRALAFIGIESGHAHEGDEEDHGDETVVHVEEAYVTHDSLGRGLSGAFGKMAAAFGRTQRNHSDQLPYLDYPLVIQNFFGEEGLRATGASFSYLFPSDRFQEFTIQALVPDEEGPLFAEARTSNPLAVLHYRTFFDFSEDLSAQLGLSFGSGPAEDGRASIFGVDYTMKNQPGTPGRYWALEAEAFWADASDLEDDNNFGWFASYTRELRPRLFGTLRYDYSEVPGSPDRLNGWLAAVTLKPSEFHHWRIEYQRVNSRFGEDEDRLTLQLQWLIGAHPAHRY